MPALSYITTCKGRLQHLQQSLARVAHQPHLECIVVDYGCPERCGDWVAAHYPSVRVVRTGPTEGFNASKARNAGAALASAPWLGFFDADILLDPAFSSLVVPELKSGNFYRANPLGTQTWGSILCQRDDFVRVGRYDECYSGWGGEDDDLVTMLRLHGLKPMGFPAALLGEIAHSDALRTRFCEIQDRWLQNRINRVYLEAKTDLLGMRRSPLSAQEAAALYAEIHSTLSKAGTPDEVERTIQVTLAPQLLGSPAQRGQCQIFEMRKTISYSVRVKAYVPQQEIKPAAMDSILPDYAAQKQATH